MLTVLIVALALSNIGLLVLADRQAGRAHDRLTRHDAQVQRLCQRLQAPDVAVLEHAAQVGHESPPTRTEWTELTEFMETVDVTAE